MFGFESDRERVEVLYTSLLLQATTQVARQRPAWSDESVAAYRRSWLHGFAAEVHRRLDAAERRAAGERSEDAGSRAGAGEPSVELVLADREEQVDRAFAETFPQIPRARAASLSGSGLRAGVAAGRRADLGTPGRRRRPDRRAAGLISSVELLGADLLQRVTSQASRASAARNDTRSAQYW